MTGKNTIIQGPHQGQPIRITGESLDRARAAMLMVHGRGARAEDILSLAGDLAVPGFAYLAPQAAENTWYPNRFLAPLASNEPWLSSALAFVGEVCIRITNSGIPPERTILLGFSQGACLALEYAARNARRYGGVVGLSGALIGPDEARRDYAGSLAGTPVFLGCSDVDFHVPKERVLAAAEALGRLGGDLTVRLYSNMEHTTNRDEIDFVRSMMQALVAGAPAPFAPPGP
jgi:phospholipase/carboxylesterase